MWAQVVLDGERRAEEAREACMEAARHALDNGLATLRREVQGLEVSWRTLFFCRFPIPIALPFSSGRPGVPAWPMAAKHSTKAAWQRWQCPTWAHTAAQQR